MKTNSIILLLIIPTMILSQEKNELPNSRVDYDGFVELTREAYEYREKRLIPFNDFLDYMKDEHTILLDTRSKEAYTAKHIKGAVHLNFSDFTDEKLAKIIPSKDTRILIYCNNNIDGDEIHFATKRMPLALNIPTFINLYGYGYKNIYELSSLLPASFIKLEFEGTSVEN